MTDSKNKKTKAAEAKGTPIGKITPKKVPASKAKDGSKAKVAEVVDEKPKPVSPEVKQKRNRTFLVAVGLLIVIASVFGWSFYNSINQTKQLGEDSIEEFQYNGFDVLRMNEQWYTKIYVEGLGQEHVVEMRHGPKEVEHIEQEVGVNAKITSAKTIYLTVAPDMGPLPVLAMVEVGRITGDRFQIYNIPTFGSLTSYNEGETPDSPIVTCQNATNETTVIHFKLGNETQIVSDENCILVEGTTEEEIVKAADRLAYSLMMMMPEYKIE